MRKIIILGLLFLASCSNHKQTKQIAEVSCGQCKFDLDTELGCSLAVRFEDKAYFIDGFDIDDFGNAHDEKIGLCNAIRKGEITGVLQNNRFAASSLKLVD